MTAKTIYVRLAGGFGNQLFQFSAAHALACSSDVSLTNIYLDARFLQSYESKHRFDIGSITSLFKYVQVAPPASYPLKYASQLRLARIFDAKVGSFDLIGSDSHLRSSIKAPNSKRYMLDGYFQHPDFVFGEAHRLMISRCLFESRRSLITSLKGGLSTVGIHIRRGDYVSSKSASRIFRTIPIDYYREAIRKLGPVKKILVFSDDRDISSQFAREIGGVDIRHLNLSLEDEFILLASCDDHVIGNSTFSWWAAYFGHTASGRVFSPKSWFLNAAHNRSNPLLLPYFETLDW